MKKLVLSFALLAGTSVAANAQGITFGVKAGGTLSSITRKNDDTNKNKFGGHGGVFANFGINDMFSVQPELLYSMKGNKIEGSSTNNGVTTTVKGTQDLNYIDVPVMIKVSTGDNNSGLFFEAGPQVGFLINAKVENERTVTSGGNTVSSKASGDNKSAFNTVDFGYAAGLGYQAESGPLVGLRYNGGLTDLYKNNSGTAYHNDAFQLYVGFRLGGR